MMLKRLSLFFPYIAFLSLPAIAFMKGKGTVILLVVLFLGLCTQYRSIPSLYTKIKDYTHPLCWACIFLIWCGLTIFWTDAPWMETGLKYIRLLVLLGMGAMTYAQLKNSSIETQRHFYKAFILGFFLCIVLYALEVTLGGWITKAPDGYNHNQLLRGVVTLSLLFWPCLGSSNNKIFQFSLFIGFLWLISNMSPDAAFLGMIVASIIYFAPVLFQKFLLTAMLIGGISTPWISKYLLNEHILFDYMRFIPTSYQHRIFMWEELSNYIFERPIFGHGFDFAAFIKSPKLLCNHYITEVMQARFPNITPLITYPGGGKLCDDSLLFGIHPHSGFLQIWLELGGIGMVLFSIFMILFYRLIQHNRLAVAMLGFYGVIFSISFNMWQNWMIATLWLGAMCLFVVNNRQKHSI